MNWDEVKRKGSAHYKTGSIEPIDLFKSGGILWDWCIGEIIAKAYRNREDASWNIDDVDNVYKVTEPGEVKKDLDEIIHYAEMLKVIVSEDHNKSQELNLRIQAEVADEETRKQLRSMSTKGHRVGTKPSSRRA